jgi:hypothetical protein
MAKRYDPTAIPTLEYLQADGDFVYVSSHPDGRLTLSEINPPLGDDGDS